MPLSTVVKLLQEAKHVVLFTGAGVSAESGIPTFRDALTGLWSRFDPGQLATAEAFRADPSLCWGWYEWRRLKVLRAQPNAAHLAIAELAQHVPKLTVVTQNVDDLHERAGSQDVIHLHGSFTHPGALTAAMPTWRPFPLMTCLWTDVDLSLRGALGVTGTLDLASSGSEKCFLKQLGALAFRLQATVICSSRLERPESCIQRRNCPCEPCGQARRLFMSTRYVLRSVAKSNFWRDLRLPCKCWSWRLSAEPYSDRTVAPVDYMPRSSSSLKSRSSLGSRFVGKRCRSL